MPACPNNNSNNNEWRSRPHLFGSRGRAYAEGAAMRSTAFVLPVLALTAAVGAVAQERSAQESVAQERVAPDRTAPVAPSPDAGSGLSIELVDPKVLRVCADPRNMPFSDEQEEGFENKIARLFAEKLGKRLAYTWYPQAPGFVRNTLGGYRCDVVMGYPQGNDLVQSTNPYYRTTYALVFKRGNGLDDVDRLTDQRLQGKHIGIVAGTPPASVMARNGLIADAKSYPLVVDTRVDSSAMAMIKDIAGGTIDAGVLWGPMAGWFAKQTNPPLAVVPLVNEGSRERFVYRITMGVRFSDQEWKRQLNHLIQENQPTIDKILADFGVPLLNEDDHPIVTDGAGTQP
jgi:quinoprotein dehydrogenase-associated probable ABC transporter substrate-binding protein